MSAFNKCNRVNTSKLSTVVSKLIKKQEFPYYRSCWNCNPAHSYFKKLDCIFTCYECGYTFYKGLKFKK